MKTRGLKLVIVFAVYVALLFGFAYWYHKLYCEDTDEHFVFNDKILESQRASLRLDTNQDIDTKRAQIDALKSFHLQWNLELSLSQQKSPNFGNMGT